MSSTMPPQPTPAGGQLHSYLIHPVQAGPIPMAAVDNDRGDLWITLCSAHASAYAKHGKLAHPAAAKAKRAECWNCKVGAAPVRRVIHTLDGGRITLEPGQIPIGRSGSVISKDDAIAIASVLQRMAADLGVRSGPGTDRLLRVSEILFAEAKLA